MSGASVAPEYFERMYARHPDPWGYETTSYEKRKYRATLAALPRARFNCAFEIGCSIGVLTRLLAARCRLLFAVDVSGAALERARTRCADLRNVRLQRMRVPNEWPNRTFDLVILSEVLYFQSSHDGRAIARKTSRGLRAWAVVVLVHWLGDTGTSRSGDTAARQFIRLTRGTLRVVRHTRNAQYRLDILMRIHRPA